MTILIKGMEMVFGGQTIEIAENVDGRKYARIQPSFDEWHEVIEIPMPHGPLIDADDFDSRIRAAGGMADEELTDDFKDGVLSVLTLMKTQNTVIEAEEG